MTTLISSTNQSLIEARPSSAGRLVVIDDEPKVAKLMARVAQATGYEVTICTEADRVRELLAGTYPSLVTLDLNMPGTDGIELLRTLAGASSGLPMNLVLVSGADRQLLDMTARLARDLGLNVVAIISKPIDLERLREVLSFCRSTPVSSARASRHPRLSISEAELASAIEDDRIRVRYQPLFSLSTLELVGVEALVRMIHPEWGEVSPLSFIPIAEESGLIEELTEVVIDRALAECSELLSGIPGFQLSLNLSPSLLDDLRLPERISRQLECHNVRPDQVTLEVTETAAAHDGLRSMEILGRFRLRGFHLSIDDFGTGTSTFTQLHNLPFGEVKIDRTFVTGAARDDGAAKIVRSIISLGHELGLRVVAEGIEDAETLYWLKNLGCDMGQGFYLSRPLDGRSLSRWASEYVAIECGPVDEVSQLLKRIAV